MYIQTIYDDKQKLEAPNGAVVLIPKDDGQGVMISAFQSREFWFGLQLNQQQLALVNAYRNNKDYCDEKVVIKLRGTSKKQALMETPFIREFEYGQNSDGYWSYERMAFQMEDCLDVVKVLHPEVDVLLLFDHSRGDDRQREDGLNVENMSKGYGGKQSKLHPSLIKQVDGYLGPFNRKLNEGDVQTMVFSVTDDGPFWMEALEREEKRKDVVISNKFVKRKYTKEDLIRKMQEKGVNGTRNMKT
jgi:hypothetical protein